MKQQFDLNYQFGLYLRRVGFGGRQIPRVQYDEMKRAFFGACGQILILCRDDIGAIEDEHEAISTMKSLLDQVGDFWLNETHRNN